MGNSSIPKALVGRWLSEPYKNTDGDTVRDIYTIDRNGKTGSAARVMLGPDGKPVSRPLCDQLPVRFELDKDRFVVASDGGREREGHRLRLTSDGFALDGRERFHRAKGTATVCADE